jgi:hypothetical protein
VTRPAADTWELTVRERLEAAARANGIWQPAYAFGRDIMASIIAGYVRAALAPGAIPADPDADRALVRKIMFDWFYIDSAEDAKPLRFGCVDPDAARLCGLVSH